MNTKSLASLVLLATFATTFPAWADTTIPADGVCPATLIDDVTITSCGILTVSSKINLAGHSLYIKGLSGFGGTGTITDESIGDPGILTLENEVTVDNGDNDTRKVKFSGNLKLVKAGAGQLNISGTKLKEHSYTGGTLVQSGTLSSTTYAAMDSETTSYGKNAIIDVASGAKFDFAGPGHASSTVNLYGSVITGPLKQKYGDNKQCAAKINLEADSSLKPTRQFGISGPLDLKGHTLTINTSSTLEWKPSSVTAGKILLEKGTLTFKGSVASPETNLEVLKEGSLALGTYNLDVRDFVSSNSVNSGSGELRVHGTFVPWNDTYYAPIMQNGSTIDLSAKEGAWAVSGTTFADGATISIEVGSREMSEETMLVTWNGTEYNGRTFNLTVNGEVSQDLAFQPQAGGLMVISTKAKIPTAIWAGTKSADALDPDNWTWRDAPVDHPSLPDGTYAVEIAWEQLTNLNWPETNALSYASLTFTGGKPAGMVVMAGNRDWRGLGGMDVPFSIDLAGKTLAMTFKDGTSAEECEVTSSAAGGVLIAKVAGEKEFDNTLVTLSGALTLVKDGAGTFVATRYPQEYAGSTIVSNGVLKCADNADLTPSKSTKSPFGAQRIVNIMPNGALDPAGSYHWNYQTINAFGGTISNTVARNGLSGTTATAKPENQFNPTINLFSNLVFATTTTFNFQGVLNPTETANGLEIRVYKGQEFVWYPTWATNLVINVAVGGYLKLVGKTPVALSKMRGSTLRMSGAALDVGQCSGYPGGFEVDNYIAEYAYEYNVGDAGMSVFGVFTPNAVDGKGNEYFRGCTMMDGSTINLCGKTGSWSTKSAMKGKNTMAFASGATVMIDVHGRTFKGREQIVEWAQGSTNGLETVTFKLDAASKAAGYSLFYKPYVDDSNKGGLWVGRKGLVFVVQ